jgi:DNA segregation ATPase FtsK/SpoIIIE, S-DNA-T family
VVVVRVTWRCGPFRFSGWGALGLWVLFGVLRLLWLVARRPRLVVAGGVGWLLFEHWLLSVGMLLSVAASVGGWAVGHPASWRRRGRPVLVGGWRRVWLYRRLWRRAVHAAGLERVNADGVRERPRLGRVRSLERVDVVAVRGLLGQRFDEWEAAAGMLAHTFHATDVRVHRGDDRRLTLELVRGRRGRSWNTDRRLELEQEATGW